MTHRLLTLLLTLTLFTGCASHTALAPLQPSQPNNTAELRNWLIEGKIGIRINEQNQSANLRWHQRGSRFHIFMSGPFGRGSTAIEGTPETLQVQRANQPLLISDHPETLLQKELGWSIPLAALPWWAKGLPSPNHPVEQVTKTEGLLKQFSQAGWQIKYLRHTQIGALQLPAKIRLSQPGKLEITLIFKQWQL